MPHKRRLICQFRVFTGHSTLNLLTVLSINYVAQLQDDLAELNEEAAGVQKERKKRRKSRSEGYNLITGESLIFNE